MDSLETIRLMSTFEVQWPEDEGCRSLMSKMTYGVTLAIARLALDYAYQNVGRRRESAHRFGVRLGL